MPATSQLQVIAAYESARNTYHFAAYDAALTMNEAYQGSQFALDKDGLLHAIKASVQSGALPIIDGDDTLAAMVNSAEWYS